MEERTGAQLELQSTAGELARREERLVGRLDEVAMLLDGVAGKVDALVAKNARELEHVLAAMLKGKHEREAMARAHQTECDALRARMQSLLQHEVASRSSRIPALASSVHARVDTVRATQLAEIVALKKRPGGLSGISGRFGSIDPVLQERLEHHDAANKLSADRIRVTVQSKLDAVNQALLQEKHAREDDTALVLLHYESAVAQIEQLQREERQQQEAAEVELLIAVREICTQINKESKPNS